MADMMSYGPWSQSLGAKLHELRSRGRSTLRAALRAPEPQAPPVLPTMQGEALAKHHLTLAIEALREQNMSKTEAFCKLRLLINKLEQGALKPAPARSRRQAPAPALPAPGRRARLLGRAFESAHLLATWRAPSPEQRV